MSTPSDSESVSSVDSEEMIVRMANDLQGEGSDNELETGGPISIRTIGEQSRNEFSQERQVDIWLKTKGRKKITAIEGLDQYPEVYEKNGYKKLLQHFKKMGCAGTMVKSNRVKKMRISFRRPTSQILSLQGNHTDEVIDYLVHQCHLSSKEIHLH